MSDLNDVVRGLLEPLQDWDVDTDLDSRNVRFATRVERSDDAGHRILQGHTHPRKPLLSSAAADKATGDVFGGQLWIQATPGSRQIPMWSYATPVVTTAPTRDTSGGTGRAFARASLLPVGDADFSADDRFRSIDAAVSPASGRLPTGWPGVMLSAIREKEQTEVFLPAGTPLIAVDHAGDPALSSLVSDVTPSGEIDPTRRARLHSLCRVVRVGANCPGLPEEPGLAWQLKPGLQDGLGGGGLVIDWAAAAGAAVEVEPATQGDGEAQTPARPQTGAVTNLGDFEAPEAREGQVGGVVQLGPTRTRDGEDSNARMNVPPSADTSALIVALASSKFGGPFEVGEADDQHRVGTTQDGEPMHSLHLATSALWLMPEVGDGPLDFETIPYSQPDSWPLSSKVHLRWDGSVGHDWTCDSRRQGRWRWEAEVPYYVPEDDEPEPPPFPPRQPPPFPPPPPPPPPGGGGGGDGDGGGGAGGDGGQEAGGVGFIPGPRVRAARPGELPPDDLEDRPEWLRELERELGLRPGSLGYDGDLRLDAARLRDLKDRGRIDVDGRLKLTPQPQRPEPKARRGRYPTFPQCVRAAAGVLFRAHPTAAGPDLTGGQELPGQLTREQLRQLDRSPDVGHLVAVAAGDQTPEGWTYRSQQGDPRASGSVLLLPAGVRAKDALESTATDVGAVSLGLVRDRGRLDVGTLDGTVGGCVTGARYEADASGLLESFLDSSGDASTAIYRTMTSTGHTFGETVNVQSGSVRAFQDDEASAAVQAFATGDTNAGILNGLGIVRRCDGVTPTSGTGTNFTFSLPTNDALSSAVAASYLCSWGNSALDFAQFILAVDTTDFGAPIMQRFSEVFFQQMAFRSFGTAENRSAYWGTRTSGTAGVNFGHYHAHHLDNAAGTNREACRFGVAWDDATDGSEDSRVYLSPIVAGSITERLRLDADGATITGDADVSGDLILGGVVSGDTEIEGELLVEHQSTETTTAVAVAQLRARSTGIIGAGFGAQLDVELPNAGGADVPALRIETAWDVLSASNEDSHAAFEVYDGGSATEVARVSKLGIKTWVGLEFEALTGANAAAARPFSASECGIWLYDDSGTKYLYFWDGSFDIQLNA